jgi:hypothetical protein
MQGDYIELTPNDSRMMRERRMTMASQGSARIYDFPQRGRFVVSAAQGTEAAAKPTPRAPAVAFGSWYHEEAIEAERTRKN